MNMISKGIIGFFAALITIASSAAYAQDTGFQPSGGDEAGPLDQVVPVAEDDAAEVVDQDTGPQQPMAISPKEQLLLEFESYKR